jgi:predicted nucleotidyltransferase
MKRREIEARTVCLAITGSQAYGLATEDSDTDYKGVFVATKPYYLGFKTIEQKDSGWQDSNGPGLDDSIYSTLDNPKDMTIYELRKFLKLSIENNPNILEMLYFDPELYLYKTEVFDKIIENRDLILSKKVKYSLSGYAYSQLRRVETHRKWLLNPPTQPPKAEDFGLTEETYLSKTELNAFIEFLYILIKDRIEWEIESEEMKSLLDEIDFKGVLTHHPFAQEALPEVQRLTRSSNDFISLLHKTQLYRKEMKQWEAYQSWLKNRNKKRAELELKCHFDSKHASHAVRLLTMGIEALNENVLYPNRKGRDADYLLEIKQGNVSYEEVMSYCETLFNQIEDAYKASSLRHSPDREAINELCVELASLIV